jgi:colanic acid/amylovoran biosynthesis glycosyltransferase
VNLPVKVTHLVYSWLPVTQNWIWSQLHFNESADSSVICMTEENCGLFPVAKKFTAFSTRTADKAGLLMARYWVRQPSAFLRRSLSSAGPDIVHGHFSTESWRVLSHAKAAGLPLITTFYGLDVDKLPRRRVWKKRYRDLFSYGTRFMVEGPFMGKRLEAIGCPAAKIRVVALGVDRSLYRHNAHGGEDGRAAVKVLFTGLSREKKGPLDAAGAFIIAAGRAPALELHCIGDGPYRQKVERMLHAAGLSDRVVFHGFVPVEQYRTLLSGSDIVLAPSRYAADGDCEGGAPVVCIEAQASGVPVVGTRHCDIPFVVIHGRTGLLSPEGARESLARDMVILAGDHNLRRSMGARGRDHAAKQHDITLQVQKITGVYREALSRGNRRKCL